MKGMELRIYGVAQALILIILAVAGLFAVGMARTLLCLGAVTILASVVAFGLAPSRRIAWSAAAAITAMSASLLALSFMAVVGISAVYLRSFGLSEAERFFAAFLIAASVWITMVWMRVFWEHYYGSGLPWGWNTQLGEKSRGVIYHLRRREVR